MEDLQKYINQLENETGQLHILVVGDIMIDRYFTGRVNRISPEAPVPILQFEKEENRFGGASNVLLNLKAMGSKISIASVVGDDEDAQIINKMLDELKPVRKIIIPETGRQTTVKTRLMSKDRHLMRMDKESLHSIKEETVEFLLKEISSLFSEHKFDAIILEDYNKGLLSPYLIQSIIQFAKTKQILVCVDPKKEHFFEYQEIALFKPNLKEAKEALNLSEDLTDPNEIVRILGNRINANLILITLASDGMISLEKPARTKLHPTQPIEVKDVSGAGDTVISLATIGLCLGLETDFIAMLCNYGAGQVCEQAGVASVKKSELLAQLRSIMA